MKKLLAAALAAILLVTSAVAFAACTGAQKTKIISIPLTEEQYSIAVKKGDTALAGQINEVLADLMGDGVTVNGKTVTLNSICDAENTAEEKGELLPIANVKKASTNRAEEFVVVTNAEFPPFEYMAGESFGGIDMQVAKIIADKLGKQLVVIHTEFESVLEELSANRADAAMAGLTITEDRKEKVDFTDPYYNSSQYIAVAEDDTRFDECKTKEDVVAVLKSLQGVNAGAADGQTGYFYLAGDPDMGFDGYKNLSVKSYSSIALAVHDLANGKVELVCGDKDTLTAAVNKING